MPCVGLEVGVGVELSVADDCVGFKVGERVILVAGVGASVDVSKLVAGVGAPVDVSKIGLFVGDLVGDSVTGIGAGVGSFFLHWTFEMLMLQSSESRSQVSPNSARKYVFK